MPPRRKQRTPTGAEVVAQVRRWLGVPYLFGGTTRRGVDCSGLILNVAAALGINGCPRTSEEQFAWADQITPEQAGPGDLVFFVGAPVDPPPGHVGILISKNHMIDAPFTGTVVREDNFAPNGQGSMRILGYRRFPGVKGSKTANGSVEGPGKYQQRTGDEASAIGSAIAWIAVILLIVLALGVMVAGGLLYSGR